MLDVDDFNPITATRPDTGSLLRCVAHALRESARADDLIARYGSEEGFVLLMSSDLEAAVEVAESICQAVERECSPEREASLSRQISVSWGLAPLAEDKQMLELFIGAADREMYRAKRAGKNGYPPRGSPELRAGPGLSCLSSSQSRSSGPKPQTLRRTREAGPLRLRIRFSRISGLLPNYPAILHPDHAVHERPDAPIVRHDDEGLIVLAV
jgi:diguanylate cyclase (GGDEF)-like protein